MICNHLHSSIDLSVDIPIMSCHIEAALLIFMLLSARHRWPSFYYPLLPIVLLFRILLVHERISSKCKGTA